MAATETQSTNRTQVGAAGAASDPARTQAFAARMVQVLNDGFLTLMTSIGHQTGLFETMATLPPATSESIAEAASLDERYVREWLGAMVTGRIVEYDAARKLYHLPPERAACLTRAAGPDDLAIFTQYLGLCGVVEPQVVKCFREGGGVPYSEYPRFQQLRAEDCAATIGTRLIQAILPLAPGVIEALQSGADVLDLGCGQGHAINLMARAFPRSRFTGWDFSPEGIAAARDEAARFGLGNARFEVRDLSALDASDAYDLITAIDTVHDLARPDEVLRGLVRALRREGTFLMIEFAAASSLEDNLDHLLGPTLYSCSVLHCMTVSLAQGGAGLGTMWGETAAQALLHKAGFTHVDVKRLEGDLMHAFYVARTV
jgi:SAM-dependent methyltransferase